MPELIPHTFESKTEKLIQEKVHLREDIMPISSQLVDSVKGNQELSSIQEQMVKNEEEEKSIHWVDFDGGDLDKLMANGFKHSDIGSYLISPISERNFFSDRFFDCTATIAIGKDKNTGKEISFLSHQDPEYFVDGNDNKKEKFSQDLSDSLKNLKARSQKNTVEVLLLGGNFNNTTVHSNTYQHHRYKQSIKILEQIVQKTLGFDPKVLTGPNNNIGSETIITLETQKRKVWVERSKQQPAEFDQPYQANKIDEEEKKWNKI